MSTPVSAPLGLPYPITISKLIASIGSHVEKGQRLFAYKFWYIVEIAKSPDENDDGVNDEHSKKSIRESIEFFDSPFEGDLVSWNVDVGDEIVEPNQTICEIVRPCNHDIVYAGICTMCGKEVDESDQVSANLTISHTDTNLKVSRREANDIGQGIKKRLIREKKLILVVDLDQTVIHCGVDPTIAEWKNDPTNPNFETLRDVKSFVLEEEPILPPMYMGPKPPTHKCWYYVKIRPGLKEFFEEVSKLYEMHIYTMATRSYAQEIAKIIDPDGTLFADRILSRNENGSLTHKSLERLFPTDQSMVVVIDDRGDVWNWCPNLIKVTPYNFFVGIGDINSNFLPRQQTTMLQLGRRNHKKTEDTDELLTDIMDTEKKLQEKIDEEVKRQEENLSHQSAALGEEISSQVRKEDITKKIEFSASLEVQQQNRPLAELQKHMHNQQLLTDDDDELFYLKDILKNVQQKYYEELKTDKEIQIQTLMPKLKKKVLEGCNFVFSGLIPLGTNIQKADIVLWTNMFGAQSSADITEDTTHVITKTPHTYKAKIAKAFKSDIKVLHPDWVFECLLNWKYMPEFPYEYNIIPTATDKELNEFKEALERRKKKETKTKITVSEESLEGDSNSPSSQGASVDLFASGASWLIDDDDDEIIDSEEEESKEPEYDEFADDNNDLQTVKKHPLESNEFTDEDGSNKKVHIAEEDEGQNEGQDEGQDDQLSEDKTSQPKDEESDSELEEEILNALDDSDDDEE
ncbi:hypothetical protein Kpol_1068p9 [Vanderwaltozyma polyspora DSM 70294]|uniref:RNA polymerase II subunit A C-terminal domain phosphatase n=1 Tax=Vanderwaltozyma polyspora (strain ATCC 22028 / DSM 70294 / BCRC 21397 / CBS 2163 / NBRC 10782 / NRRL Y-8283 / UCD 57-17) TaxID=436907 RepID=A7TSR4_VANPO|nr:uncharacterized protein Kpol_1068p9 [Vanderwaltozyma polyspora DSM 70294]EDO14699.1 hypothetical protein Kpol_1068p9 [Vanderwaltozyma polyspora DSM 70294]